MTTGVLNYPRRKLSDQERTIRATLARIAAATPATPGDVQTTRKTSDQIIASATLADAGLEFVLINGTYYHYKFVVLFRSADTTIGPKVTVSYPSVTAAGATAQILFAADGAAALWSGAITTSLDTVTATDVPVASTDYIAIIEGVILPSAAGVLKVQAANESGTTNLTVRQGSCGILTAV